MRVSAEITKLSVISEEIPLRRKPGEILPDDGQSRNMNTEIAEPKYGHQFEREGLGTYSAAVPDLPGHEFLEDQIIRHGALGV